MKDYSNCEFEHEKIVFKELEILLKEYDDKNLFLYPNIYLKDTSQSLSLECDLIAISKKFICIIELKDYYGDIYISDYKWERETKYKREVIPNFHITNKKKCQILKSHIETNFPAIQKGNLPWIQSIVVFTHPNSNLYGNKSSHEYFQMKKLPKELTLLGANELGDYFTERLELSKDTNCLEDNDLKELRENFSDIHKSQQISNDDKLQFNGYSILADISHNKYSNEFLVEQQGVGKERKRFRILCKVSDKKETVERVLKMSKLHHNNIRRTEFFHHSSLIIESIDWNNCQTIHDCIKKNAQFSIKIASKIILNIAKGLEYVHKSDIGLIHRNINPNTVLLNLDNTPEIIDFDSAYDPMSENTIFPESSEYNKLDKNFTASEVFQGKPEYKSDVYSLGKLFEFMVIDKSQIESILNSMIEKDFDKRASMQEIINILSKEEITTIKEETTQHTWKPIYNLINSGATADIYKLENQGEVSVVKVFKEKIPKELILNERDILNSINSQYVVKYKNYDIYLPPRVGINMEIIEGKTLKEMSNEDMSFNNFCNIIEQLLEGLNDIHTNLDNIIIHNDLSPRNIMYTTDNTIKLIDFGSASSPGFINVCGSTGYIADDLVEDGLLDSCPSGDLYAVSKVFNLLYDSSVIMKDELEEHQITKMKIWLEKGCKSKRKMRFQSAKEMSINFKNVFTKIESIEKTAIFIEKETTIKTKIIENTEILVEKEANIINEFVSYLNTLHNVTSDNQNALAESQATNSFFNEIYVRPLIVENIINEFSQSTKKNIILTGHAGDGKSTIALDVFKELNIKLDATLPLETPMNEEEKFKLKSGMELIIIKDMSELSSNRRTEILKNALDENNNSSYLIVTNTGPLLNTYCDIYEDNDNVEDDILSALNTPMIDKITEEHKLEIEHSQATIINLAKVDNIKTIKDIILNIIKSNYWDKCKGCKANDNCHIFKNIKMLNQTNGAVNRIGWIYRRLATYDKRMTLRQMIAHIVFSITANDNCEMIQQKNYSNPNESPKLSDYLFSNLFFGFDGLKYNIKQNSLFAIRQIKNYDFGSTTKPFLERLLISLQSTSNKILIESDLGSTYNKYLRENSCMSRYALRRLLFIFGGISIKEEENLFLELFLKSPKLIDYDNWLNDGFQLSSSDKNELRKNTLNVIQELFLGMQVLIGKETRYTKLYITIRRSDEELLQPVQILLASFNYKTDFNLQYNNKTKNLELVYVKCETVKLELPLPLIDYIHFRNLGEYGNELNSIYINQLECFKSDLLSASKANGIDEEIGLINIGHNGNISECYISTDSEFKQLTHNI